jgi:hypothetical protein
MAEKSTKPLFYNQWTYFVAFACPAEGLHLRELAFANFISPYGKKSF